MEKTTIRINKETALLINQYIVLHLNKETNTADVIDRLVNSDEDIIQFKKRLKTMHI